MFEWEEWKEAGWENQDEAKRWYNESWGCPKKAIEWYKAKWGDPKVAGKWFDVGWNDPYEAMNWYKKGWFDPVKAINRSMTMKKERIEKIIQRIIIKGLEEEIVVCLDSARANLDYAKRDEDFNKRTRLAIESIEDAVSLYEELKKYKGGN